MDGKRKTHLDIPEVLSPTSQVAVNPDRRRLQRVCGTFFFFALEVSRNQLYYKANDSVERKNRTESINILSDKYTQVTLKQYLFLKKIMFRPKHGFYVKVSTTNRLPMQTMFYYLMQPR